jgi:hypothetical protein
VAENSHRILLSDDYRYRILAAQIGKLPSTWLQPVLMIARDKGKLAPAKYDDAIYFMLSNSFDYVSMDLGVLLRAAKVETDVDGRRFDRMAGALGGPTADMKSHVAVARLFLQSIWREADASLKEKAQTSRILECLLTGRTEDFWIIIRILLFLHPPSRKFKMYFRDWLAGHFYLPPPPSQLMKREGAE